MPRFEVEMIKQVVTYKRATVPVMATCSRDAVKDAKQADKDGHVDWTWVTHESNGGLVLEEGNVDCRVVGR